MMQGSNRNSKIPAKICMMPVLNTVANFLYKDYTKNKNRTFFTAVDAQRFGGLPEYVNQLKRENVR
jgi:hypothetical protein